MKWVQRRAIFLLMALSVAVATGCAPIDATTTTQEQLVSEELRQEPVGEEFSVETAAVGSDPRRDAEIAIDVTKHLQCEERTVAVYERQEITERSIENWWIPIGIGVLGALSFGCMAVHMAEEGCLPEEDEDGEPLVESSSDHKVASAFFGAVGVGSMVTIGVDLGRTRTSTEQLANRESASSPRQVDCGDVPGARVQVELVDDKSRPIWDGVTDRQGRATVQVSELSWLSILEEGQSMGDVLIQGTSAGSLDSPPASWLEVRTEMVAEEVFRRASQARGPEPWLEAWEVLADTGASEEAFERFVQAMDDALESGKGLSRLQRLIDGGRRLESSDHERRELRRLQADVALRSARKGAEGELNALEVVTAYEQAHEAVENEDRAEEIRKEGLAYGLEALDQALEGEELNSGDRRMLAELVGKLNSLAEFSYEREELERRQQRLGDELVAGALSRARNRRDQQETQGSEAVEAYVEAWEQAREMEHDDAAAIGREFLEFFAERLADEVEEGRRRAADEVFEEAQAYFDDETMEGLREEYLDAVLRGYRRAMGTADASAAQRYERWIESMKQEGDEVRVVEALLGGLIDFVDAEAAAEGASTVEAVRLSFKELAADADPEFQTVVEEKTTEMRATLRRHFSPAQLQSEADVRWLYPPSVQVQNVLDQPGHQIGERTMLTLRVVEDIGQGTSLATETGTGGNILVTGLGQAGTGLFTVLAEVVDSVPDARGDSGSEIPKLRVLWSR